MIKAQLADTYRMILDQLEECEFKRGYLAGIQHIIDLSDKLEAQAVAAEQQKAKDAVYQERQLMAEFVRSQLRMGRSMTAIVQSIEQGLYNVG